MSQTTYTTTIAAFALLATTLIPTQQSQAVPLPNLGKLRYSKAISCSDKKVLTLDGYHISGQSTGITIDGQCHIHLKNSFVRGYSTGILVTGKGKLILENTVVKGGLYGINTLGNAQVSIKNSVVKGRYSLFASGRSNIQLKDGNRLRGQTSTNGTGRILRIRPGLPPTPTKRPVIRRQAPPAQKALNAPPKGLKKAQPIHCVGNNDLTLTKRYIDTTGTAIVLVGNCGVTITQSWIRGNVAISIMGNGTVTIKNSVIIGRNKAINIIGNGDVSLKNSHIKGRISKLGSGDITKRGGNTFTP
jgi:hypothetical protein